MKPNNPDNKKLIERCFRWSNLLALAGLAAGVASYVSLQNRINTAEHNTQLTDNLNELTQYSVLLREINTGDTNRATAFLRSKLASDFQEVAALETTSDAKGKEFANIVLHTLARDEKAHPEYYMLASARLTKPVQAQMAQARRP